MAITILKRHFKMFGNNFNYSGKIYVLCPAYYATGGTELLHQVVYKLRNLFGVKAFIYYPDVDWKFEVPPTPPRFKKYVGEYLVFNIEDSSSNFLIFPETNVGCINQFKSIRKAMWWLSVDNFYLKLGIQIQDLSNQQKFISFIKARLGTHPYNFINQLFQNKYVSKHLVQSRYAFEFLRTKGVKNVDFLSDYLNSDLFRSDASISERHDQVLYNPLKGKAFTEKLMAVSPYLKWVPLAQMSTDEVAAAMMNSKVYIDFGNHPGKDRMPREAAINGCIIITGTRGAAAFFEDVAIPSRYKFVQEEKNIPLIINAIENSIDHYQIFQKDFEDYKQKIKNEELVFDKELGKLMETICSC